VNRRSDEARAPKAEPGYESLLREYLRKHSTGCYEPWATNDLRWGLRDGQEIV
jgi:hypothetical protein